MNIFPVSIGVECLLTVLTPFQNTLTPPACGHIGMHCVHPLFHAIEYYRHLCLHGSNVRHLCLHVIEYYRHLGLLLIEYYEHLGLHEIEYYELLGLRDQYYEHLNLPRSILRAPRLTLDRILRAPPLTLDRILRAPRLTLIECYELHANSWSNITSTRLTLDQCYEPTANLIQGEHLGLLLIESNASSTANSFGILRAPRLTLITSSTANSWSNITTPKHNPIEYYELHR